MLGLGATFTPNYTTRTAREDSYKFCWQTNTSHGRNTPYYFTIKGVDNRVPIPGSVVRAFSVRVYAKPDVTLTKIDQHCGYWQVAYIKNKPEQVFSGTSWKIARQPNDYTFSQGYDSSNLQIVPLFFKQTGKYMVQFTAKIGGCPAVFYDTVNVDTLGIQLTLRDTFTCKNQPLMLSATALNGKAPYTYKWYNTIMDTITPLNTPNFTTPSFSVTPAQSRRYTLQVKDINGCKTWDSVSVSVSPTPSGIIADSMRICSAQPVQLAPVDSVNTQYNWSTGDSVRKITISTAGVYKVTLKNTLSGCTVSDSIKINVNPIPVVAASNDTVICKGVIVTLKATGAANYKWYRVTVGDTISTLSAFNYVPSTSTLFGVLGSVTSLGVTCSNRDTVNIAVNPVPSGFTSHNTKYICSGQSVLLSPTDTGANTQYKWSTNETTKSIAVTSAGNYKLNMKDAVTGCSLNDSLSVGVNPTPTVAATVDTFVCLGSTIQLKATGAVNYKWYRISVGDTIGTTANINITPIAATNYGVLGSVTLNGITCSARDTVNVGVATVSVTMPTTQNVCLSDSVYTMSPVVVTAGLGKGSWYHRLYNAMLDSSAGTLLLKALPVKPASPNWEVKYVFYYTYKDIHSCSKTDSVSMMLRDAAISNAGRDSIFCRTDIAFNLTDLQNATPGGGIWSGPSVSSSASKYYFDPSTGFRFPETNKLVYSISKAFAGGFSCQRNDTVLMWVYPPTPPVITGDSITPPLSTKTYSVVNHPGASYNWNVSGGAQTSGGNTNIIEVLWGSGTSGRISVNESILTSCPGDSSTLRITLGNVGINEISTGHYNLYPNPTTGWIELQSSTGFYKENITVTDLLGKQIPVMIQETENGASRTYRFNLGEYPNGVYLVNVSNEQFTRNFKVIKQ